FFEHGGLLSFHYSSGLINIFLYHVYSLLYIIRKTGVDALFYVVYAIPYIIGEPGIDTLFFSALLNLILNVVRRIFQLLHALSQSSRNFRYFIGTKDHHGNKHDKENF